jgi:pimeloyl-ACP methyl ester carboxylesterase
VFVHGWSCDRSYWSGQLDWFSAGHQVVAVDLAGHGQSGAGRWPTDTESLGRYGVSAVTMPEAGHFPMMEDPGTFDRLLAEAVEGFKG